MEPKDALTPSVTSGPRRGDAVVDRDADFSAYVAARWTSLVRMAVFLGCSIEEAQDLTQTALMRCYVAWKRVQRAENPDGYVYRVLINCHRDVWRRRSSHEVPGKTPVPEEPTSEQAPDAGDLAATTDAIHRALAELSSEARAVVVLRHLLQLSEQETADALAVPVGTVKSRLSRALSRLADSQHLLEMRGDLP
jgi:RNA polymerase sigma-70 factor (sigma-E family)